MFRFDGVLLPLAVVIWVFSLGTVFANDIKQQPLSRQDRLSIAIENQIEQTMRYRYPQQYQLEVKQRFSKALNKLPSCSGVEQVSTKSEIKLGTQKWSIHCPSEGWTTAATTTSRITVQAAITTRAIKKGERLSREDVTFQSVTLSKDQKVFFEPNQLVGSKVKRSLSQGELLTTSRFYLDYDVEKGLPVNVVYRSKTFSLQTQGTALESGLIGDTVAVKNNQSGKRLRAVVIDSHVVQVY
ncbi:flagellar basal body P-ring formation chaperone FlgA [Vibrio cionasavignyae]|uniref:flagellar basal body P-ring formation chaperone FlgA n=1 Tax=Vibrio cionasavignyae TaxID=2910252 RepID=UPI003D10B675